MIGWSLPAAAQDFILINQGGNKMKCCSNSRFFVFLFLAFAVLISSTPSGADTQIVTVNSHSHCCFNSALTAVLQPGGTTVTYLSGAWNNHVPSGVYLGFVWMEIPDLDVGTPLGTETQIGFPTYAEAENAAMGDFHEVQNNLEEAVTVSFYVFDTCQHGGYCHDNSGEVVLSLTNDTVANDRILWSTIKALYR